MGGKFLAMKSVDSADEVDRAARAIAKLGGRLLPRVDYEIPGTGVTHRVVVVEKISHTPKGYPRRWARMQKTPLNPRICAYMTKLSIASDEIMCYSNLVCRE